MSCSEKLSDNIFLEKCEVYSTKKANIAFALALIEIVASLQKLLIGNHKMTI